LVRIIAYTLTDPAVPGYGEVHRLVTTLRDPRVAPARDVVCLYHGAGESQLVVDETATRQRLAERPLHSHKPEGVLPKLYALLIAHYSEQIPIRQGFDNASLLCYRTCC
jgi:hypothetical protein